MNLYHTSQQESDAAADFRNAARYDSDVRSGIAVAAAKDGAK